MALLTANDLIEETARRIMPAQLDISCATSTSLAVQAPLFTDTVTLTGPMITGVNVGYVLGIGLELLMVTGWVPSTGVATVLRGFMASPVSAHSTNSLVWIQPKFSRFDILQALNEELNDLSSPTAGLFQILTTDITYNPVFMGYDFPVQTGLIDVLGIRYRIAYPNQNLPPIRRWAVLPSTGPGISFFPSGQGLIIYESGWPGLPLHVWYSAAFGQLQTTATTVGSIGLPATAADIVPVGAAIILNNSREIKRNFTEAQPDPRKAQEVPPQAVMNATKAMEMWRMNRIAAERARLVQQTKYLRVR